MGINRNKRDAVFAAYNEADNEYREAYTYFDQIYSEIEQSGHINVQQHGKLQTLEDKMHQLGEKLDELKKIILEMANED